MLACVGPEWDERFPLPDAAFFEGEERVMTDQQLLDSFRRDADGNWTCIRPILFDGPARNLAVMPGTTIKPTDYVCGMKIARELDEAEIRHRRPIELKNFVHH
jgi:hypothetical protein